MYVVLILGLWTLTLVNARFDRGVDARARQLQPPRARGHALGQGDEPAHRGGRDRGIRPPRAADGERALEVTLDNNDRYELELVADTPRRIVVGPAAKAKLGLARYTPRVDPPLAGVRMIRLRPLSGDSSYSMGHLIVR